MKIPNPDPSQGRGIISLARIVSEDSQPSARMASSAVKSSKDS